jgi:FKBP-type peptidyl-prolyl cis-trans isomerase SlyD
MTDLTVTRDKIVSVTYALRNQHGEHSELFPKIEAALEGKRVGERVTVLLSPFEGFGAHDANLTFTNDVENSPPELRQLGMEFEAQNGKGENVMFHVTRLTDGKITVDANHPLAGQTVSFDVTVVDVRDPTPEERRTGRPADDGAFPALKSSH